MLNKDVAKNFECFFLTKSLIQIWGGGQHGNAADFALQKVRHRHVVRRDNECEILTFVPTQTPEDSLERLDKTLPQTRFLHRLSKKPTLLDGMRHCQIKKKWHEPKWVSRL